MGFKSYIIISVKEQNFYVTFVLGKFKGMKVPRNESSTFWTFIPGNESYPVWKLHNSTTANGFSGLLPSLFGRELWTKIMAG